MTDLKILPEKLAQVRDVYEQTKRELERLERELGIAPLDANPPTQVSGEDERDALEQYPVFENEFGEDLNRMARRAFELGRKGTVPASEVEKLQCDVEALGNQLSFELKNQTKWIAEAVKAERERCAKIVHDRHGNFGVKTANLILNPCPSTLGESE